MRHIVQAVLWRGETLSRRDDYRRLQERVSNLEQLLKMLMEDAPGSRVLWRDEALSQREENWLIQERVSNLERALRILVGDPHNPRWMKPNKEWNSREIDYLTSLVYETERAIQALRKSEQEHHIQTLDIMASMTEQLPDPSVAVNRIFPITVYLDGHDAESVKKVQAAIRQVIAEADWDLAFEGDGIPGSWFGRFFARSKEALTSEQTKAELRRIERALEIQALHLPQSQIDAAQSDGVAKLITALANTSDALILIGSVLLIKVDGVLTVRNLTQVELAYIEHNKNLYKSPKDMLEELTRITPSAGISLSQNEENARPL